MDDIRIHDLVFTSFISKEEIATQVAELGKRLSADYSGKNPVILGVLSGSFIFVADLARAMSIPANFAFTRLSSYSGTGSTGEVNQMLGVSEDLNGRHVVVVEDIVDTGNTIVKLDEIIRDLKPSSVEYCALFLKPEAYKKSVKIKYVGFEIPNAFIVGYGLDYEGIGRNLPAVYQLKSE